MKAPVRVRAALTLAILLVGSFAGRTAEARCDEGRHRRFSRKPVFLTVSRTQDPTVCRRTLPLLRRS